MNRRSLGRSARSRVFGAVTLVAVVVAGACGSDGGDAASTTTAPATEARSDQTAVVSRSDDPFCVKVQEASEKFGFGSSSSEGLADALAQLPEVAPLLAEARAVAPEELRADLDVLTATLGDVAPLLAQMSELQADPSRAAELQALGAEFTAKLAALQSPEFAAAIGNLDTYTAEACGITFT